MHVRINKIIRGSKVDGPGNRNVVFFQGCTLACKGCQNKHLWDADAGAPFDVKIIARELLLETNEVTISGGEPFQQPEGLLALLHEIRNYRPQGKPQPHVIVYSGYEFDVLLIDHPEILELIDVLVDGPFIAAQDHPLLMWRGSENQRPIDIPSSLFLSTNLVQTLMILDWDEPEIILTNDGDALMPVGLAAEFDNVGYPKTTRMCGETNE